MIVLDTNVVTEMMKASPSPAVVSWLNEQESSALFLTAVTLGEISFGLSVLPQGRRRLLLEQGFERMTAEAFTGRVLDFDEKAARRYGAVMGRRRKMGRPLGILDAQIAAIAGVNGGAVATRNVRDFLDCGVEVIDPFEPSAHPARR